MSTRLRCPHCRVAGEISEDLLGKVCRCQACTQVFRTLSPHGSEPLFVAAEVPPEVEKSARFAEVLSGPEAASPRFGFQTNPMPALPATPPSLPPAQQETPSFQGRRAERSRSIEKNEPQGMPGIIWAMIGGGATVVIGLLIVVMVVLLGSSSSPPGRKEATPFRPEFRPTPPPTFLPFPSPTPTPFPSPRRDDKSFPMK